MGLSGDESVFIRTLIDNGRNVYHDLKMSDGREARLKMANKLERGGYLHLHLTFPDGIEETWATITEAGKDVIAAQYRIGKAYSDGMAGGKKMFANAVNRLRAKLSNQQVMPMLNKLYKHFSRFENLADIDRDLLEDAKKVLKGDVVYTPVPQPININGMDVQAKVNLLSYDDVVELAQYKGHPSITVRQQNKDQGPINFILSPGDTLFIERNQKVNIQVCHTSNA